MVETFGGAGLVRGRRWLKWLLIGLGVVVVAAVVAPFVYINFIRDDPPPKLSLEDVPSETTSRGSSDPTAGSADGSLAGTYDATQGSQAGYRATEVLFGQRADAAGRTTDVTGTVVIAGETVDSAEFTVQMANVKSDEERRDNQYRTRIMDVQTFPTSTFQLTSPIELPTTPPAGQEITVSATGNLTVRGVTKPVTFDLHAKQTGPDTLAVQGSIPITWSDWSIPEPSFGPAQVDDSGEIEFLLALQR
jgi:polyisoprenoid-binding protein YceI